MAAKKGNVKRGTATKGAAGKTLAKKGATRKPAAKKAAAKTPAAKKPAAKKAAAKTPAARKDAARRAAARKDAAKKAAAKRPAARISAIKRGTARRWAAREEEEGTAGGAATGDIAAEKPWTNGTAASGTAPEIGGVHREDPRAGAPAPAFKVLIDAALLGLARLGGGDLDLLHHKLASIDVSAIGPWNYLAIAIHAARRELIGGAVGEKARSTWLGHLLLGEDRAFLGELEKNRGDHDHGPRVDIDAYPPEARRVLHQDLLVGGKGGDLLCLWRIQQGVARVCVVNRGGVRIIGEDVLDFVRKEAAALGVDVGDAPAPAAPITPEPSVKILTADYQRPPTRTGINRVGGLPIGVDARSWPRHQGKPMSHILTIDLREHPDFRPRDYRALALFLSSPGRHEAYGPGSSHARVLLLTEGDLRKGVPAWPAQAAADDRLPAGTLRFEPGDELTRAELFKRSFMGGDPIWLQAPEGLRGVDLLDDQDDGRPDAPMRFVLQFGEELAPVHLGDSGVMYVYAETAWFQCH